MKRVLMVAFHFPPAAGSSGIQRTLRFVQHLPSLGWEPVVLTVRPAAHERTSPDLLGDVPVDVKVIRTFALDTARHLSIGGRYPSFLARPDRWQSWRLSATLAGLSAIRNLHCDAIWSTYPIATAHRIAASVHEKTRIPWIADFRDPMAQEGYPVDPRTWRSFKAIEEHTIGAASRSVFTTPGAANLYRRRYPTVPNERIVVIENGYDEDTFAVAERSAAPTVPIHPGRLTLLHSGIVYPSERDPTQIIAALAMLEAQGVISPTSFCLRFRASACDALIARLAREAGVGGMVDLQPALAYREALQEMLQADGLVVIQASNCNAQIPAKLYEYIRAKRPVLGLTDPRGDTAGVLIGAGIQAIAALDSAPAIADLIRRFVAMPSGGEGWTATTQAVSGVSRHARAAELAELLDLVCAPRA